MTEPRPHPRPAWLGTLVFAVAAAGGIIVAAEVMFSAFMFYDDEGYVLLSLRNFAAQGGLYRDVYSQYGPFPFVFHYVLNLLGLPLTHTAGRLITLGAWSGSAILCAGLVGRVTRSLGVRLAVLAAVFAYLWVMASEPTHPGGLIVFLTTAVAVLGHHWLVRDQMRAWAVLVGAVTAALLLTKINIGVFVAFSACAWLLLHHRAPAIRRWAPAALFVCGIVLPLALMRPLLGTDWVQSFALVWACAALAVIRAISLQAGDRGDGRTLGWGLLGAAIVGALVIAVTVGRGSSLADVWGGVVLAPLRQPTTFSIRYLWAPGIRGIALASLALCLIAGTFRRGQPGVDTAIAVARLLAALALAVNLARFPDISADYLVFGFALPCLWLFAWPLAGERSTTSQARAWLILVLLGQCLHVFPVAGSQIAWGSLLTIPVAAIGAWDAAAWLARRREDALPASAGRHRAALAGGLLMAIFSASLGWKFFQVGQRYREGEYLGLPGAEMLRLPEGSSAVFRLLTLNAVAHADLLFSEPGMFSFNIWSGVPTPTHANVTHWFSLLPPERQQAIIHQLESHPRACVIVHREHVNFLTQRGLAPTGVLHDYIAREFTPVFTFDDFEFCVHRARRITPYLVGEILTRSGAAGVAPSGENTLLRFSLLLPTPQPIAWIELVPKPAPAAPPFRLDASNTRVEITPLNPRGDPSAAAHPAAWPLAISGPCTVSLYYDRDQQPRPARDTTIVLQNAAGQEVGLARLQR